MAYLNGYLRWWHRRRSKNRRGRRPVILVTGCSRGVGLSVAHLIQQRGDYRLVATARADSLSQLQEYGLRQSDRLWLRPLDVTDAEQRRALISEIGECWGGVDILVNNAGISYRSVVEHMSEEEEIDQLATNYLGPMSLIRLVLPHMRRVGRGKIINVSSVSGMLAMPTMSSYSASKFALEGASESLWYELKPLGVNVTLVQPGFIHSDSFKRVCYSHLAAACATEDSTAYGDYYRNMSPFIGQMMNLSRTSPKQVAMKILRIIRTQNPPLRVAGTMDAKVFYYLRRLVPRRFFHRLLFRCLPHSQRWGRGYSHARHPHRPLPRSSPPTLAP